MHDSIAETATLDPEERMIEDSWMKALVVRAWSSELVQDSLFRLSSMQEQRNAEQESDGQEETDGTTVT
jgi:hypothetical protein